jgi:hypothetical protein
VLFEVADATPKATAGARVSFGAAIALSAPVDLVLEDKEF